MYINQNWISLYLREATKKVLLLMTGPLRPNSPSPLELNCRWNVGTLGKKGYQKKFLYGHALYPPPLLMARPLREELLFRLPLPKRKAASIVLLFKRNNTTEKISQLKKISRHNVNYSCLSWRTTDREKSTRLYTSVKFNEINCTNIYGFFQGEKRTF